MAAIGHPSDNPPLCASCSKNVPRAARWPAKPGGIPVLREEMKCEAQSLAHPNAMTCRAYVREPGAD